MVGFSLNDVLPSAISQLNPWHTRVVASIEHGVYLYGRGRYKTKLSFNVVRLGIDGHEDIVAYSQKNSG